MPPHVVVDRFSKCYGAVEAVRSVSFMIGRGEIFGLLGPNGAGKTTTLECLVGLREPDTGELKVGGLDLRTHPRAAKQKIGVALQEPALPEKITAREALWLFGQLYPVRAAPDELLRRFGLVEKADTPFDALSGGQRQRLSLALALVNEPELVVFDEPTNGLDPQSRREIHAEIFRLKAKGHTVLLSTHHLEEAERLCDRVAIIDRGRLVASGPPRELLAQADAKQVVTFVTAQAIDRAALALVTGISIPDGEGNAVRLPTRDVLGTLTALAAFLAAERIELIDLRVGYASLEDVFLHLTHPKDETGARNP